MMKNPLQSLLIAFAIGLCGLCTWQWYGQMLQQKRINALAQSDYDQSAAIQGYIIPSRKWMTRSPRWTRTSPS